MKGIPGAKTAAFLAVILSLPALQEIHAEGRTMSELTLSSPAFPHEGMIPPQFTCDGSDASPPLAIANVPGNAKSLALIVDDPDAPVGTWVHWVIWNIGSGTKEIPENSVPQGALQGTNDFGKQRYGGPCPPSGTHRYFFKLYALDAPLPLKAGAGKASIEEAMQGHILARTELVGRYRRK
jgi:Raf kinase inhibitor-like YbhB/YbcL family protein